MMKRKESADCAEGWRGMKLAWVMISLTADDHQLYFDWFRA